MRVDFNTKEITYGFADCTSHATTMIENRHSIKPVTTQQVTQAVDATTQVDINTPRFKSIVEKHLAVCEPMVEF